MQSKERKIIGIIAFTLVILFIASFTLFQSRNLIAGPQIVINYPQNGETVENSLTEILGNAQNISEIKLNGRNIFVNEEGDFKENVLLSYGYNLIVFEIKDRFNRKEIKKLELILK